MVAGGEDILLRHRHPLANIPRGWGGHSPCEGAGRFEGNYGAKLRFSAAVKGDPGTFCFRICMAKLLPWGFIKFLFFNDFLFFC